MRELPARWKKIIALMAVAFVLVFGGLVVRYFYVINRDIPRAPCFASIDFVHTHDHKVRWHGVGDMTIDPKEGALYVYYVVKTPEGKVYTYDRKFGIALTHLDTSRFLFKTRSVVKFDADTAGDELPFMERGFQGGMVTFNYFSDAEYYYNINNLINGVCHVPR